MYKGTHHHASAKINGLPHGGQDDSCHQEMDNKGSIRKTSQNSEYGQAAKFTKDPCGKNV